MILEALVSQLEQRFQHEKRARFCLFFDERGEFARLLPLLEAHVSARSKPPFVVLAYDEAKRRGQIWLKYQVHKPRSARGIPCAWRLVPHRWQTTDLVQLSEAGWRGAA